MSKLSGRARGYCIGISTNSAQGSLWYFDEIGKRGYPYAAGVIIGIGAGMVFVTAGYIQLAYGLQSDCLEKPLLIRASYPEEQEKGSYITMQSNIQALGSVIGGIIPVIINRQALAQSILIYIR